MKIVELLGQSNSGKTTTLNLVYSTNKTFNRQNITTINQIDCTTVITNI